MRAASIPRQDALELVAVTLISRTSRLSGLLMGRGSRQLWRTEAGVLSTLLDGAAVSPILPRPQASPSPQ